MYKVGGNAKRERDRVSVRVRVDFVWGFAGLGSSLPIHFFFRNRGKVYLTVESVPSVAHGV